MPFLLCLFSGIAAFFISRYFPFVSIFIFSAAGILLVRRKRGLLLFAVAGGFLYAMIMAPPGEDPVGSRNSSDRELKVKGRFLARAELSVKGPEIRPFLIEQAADSETEQEIEELEDERIWVRSDAEFDPEETYALRIRTDPDRKRLNPGSANRTAVFARILEAHMQSDDRRAFGTIFERFRQALRAHMKERFSSDSAAFLSAVTIGEADLGEDLKHAFNAAGLAHILSISGTHFGLFSIMIFGLFRALIRWLPYGLLQRLTLYISPTQAAALFSLPLMAFYLALSGGSVPAVRSFIMIIMFLAGLLLGRKGFWLNTVFLAAVLLALWDPSVVLGISFQLSFIAVLFIGFALERDRAEEESPNAKEKKGVRDFIVTSIRISIAATLGTALLVAYHFHYFSLISPIANLVIAPLIGFGVIPLAVISSLTYLMTGVYLFGPLVSIGTDISLWAVRTLAAIPYADIAVPSFPPGLIILFYLLFIPFLVWSRRKELLVLPFLPVIFFMISSIISKQELSVVYLDVGQGDAAIIELPDGKTMAIDTGRTGYEVVAYLRYIGKRRLDILTITHSHPDHAGGSAYLLDCLPVRELWDNGRVGYDRSRTQGIHRRILERGDLFSANAYRLMVLHPYKEFSALNGDEYSAENNASLVLKLLGKRHSFLFIGDVEEDAEDDLVHLGAFLRSDVIKVPHHGGKTSVHQGLLSEISPSIAAISVGRDNSFGHPSSEMIEALSDIRIYRTDRDGAIKITETEKGLSVKTYRSYLLAKADNGTEELRNLKKLFSSW